MTLSRWVRAVSEKELLVAAQTKVARRYGRPAPSAPKGAEVFWQRVYVPVFHALPARLRDGVSAHLPGSHRRTWHQPAQASGPAAVLVRSQRPTERPGQAPGG